ncbi:MAG: hypothetical protein HKN19_11680 [Halioglobus sp.]|nr:hypothetical protein [Halioglobus sp.]
MKSLLVVLALLLSPLAMGEEAPAAAAAADLKVTKEQKEQIRELMHDGVDREEARKQVLSEEQLQVQPRHKVKKKHRKANGKLLHKLDLTEEQQQQIDGIRAAGGGREEIHAVLTEEQKAELDVLKRERKSESKGKGKGKGEGGGKRKQDKQKEPEPAAAEEAEESD